ncbi:hypothetical protein HELRODRAFT_91356 [Helobdella robusta]|uniref:Uncharacterized protein n=1 Tax=Helobdella robusta TaxID=6412 RepID=T1G829_HELRO|nr:hypothetical protein HELRODRAFT_91356 [Helobdella robusta]ESN89821.1 hypothetical protein HELRODRAFT_91356 [Helobdella robusta]
MIRNRHLLEAIDERTDLEDDSKVTNHSKKSKSSRPISLENVAWVSAALAVCYFTDIVNTVLYHDDIDRSWLQASAVFCVVFISIAAFLIVYLYLIRGIDPDDWDKIYPSAIPSATASSLLCGLCLLIAIWPVYGLLSMLILFVVFMGLISVVCMLDVFTFLCKKPPVQKEKN